jgi:geranylgeranyl pyrophosphate synthase
MQDDVEDDSQARRGQPCTHHKFGVDTAINTGTIMFYWPMVKIMNDDFVLGKEKKLLVYDLYIKEMLRVCSGQVWDIAWHNGGFTPNESQYLNMCLSKTGVLTKFACQLGAIIGNATEEQFVALGNFGQIIGVGFQIQDDILELTEQDFKKGKGSIGGDIHEGKRTLIVIRTLEVASEEDKKRLIEILDSHTTKEDEIQEALNIINKYDGIVYSKKKAEELVEDAWKKIDFVLPESNAKIILKKFAEYLVDRKI